VIEHSGGDIRYTLLVDQVVDLLRRVLSPRSVQHSQLSDVFHMIP
jgi:hypothetical protein